MITSVGWKCQLSETDAAPKHRRLPHPEPYTLVAIATTSVATTATTIAKSAGINSSYPPVILMTGNAVMPSTGPFATTSLTLIKRDLLITGPVAGKVWAWTSFFSFAS